MDKQGVSGFEEIVLARRSDDFSEQFSTPDDLLFWIRIEAPVSEVLVVSDLLFGALDEYRMASALGQALHLIEMRRPRQIVFKNVGLIGCKKSDETLARIQRVVEALVARQRRFITSRDINVDGEKLSLVFTFKSFDSFNPP